MTYSQCICWLCDI